MADLGPSGPSNAPQPTAYSSPIYVYDDTVEFKDLPFWTPKTSRYFPGPLTNTGGEYYIDDEPGEWVDDLPSVKETEPFEDEMDFPEEPIDGLSIMADYIKKPYPRDFRDAPAEKPVPTPPPTPAPKGQDHGTGSFESIGLSNFNDCGIDPSYDLIRWGSVSGYESYKRETSGVFKLHHKRLGPVNWCTFQNILTEDGTSPVVEVGNSAMLKWATESWCKYRGTLDGWMVVSVPLNGHCLGLVFHESLWLLRPFGGFAKKATAVRYYKNLIARLRRMKLVTSPIVKLLDRDFNEDSGILHEDQENHMPLPPDIRRALAVERKRGLVTYCDTVPMRPSYWWSYLQAINDCQAPRCDRTQIKPFHKLFNDHISTFEEWVTDVFPADAHEQENNWVLYKRECVLKKGHYIVPMYDLILAAGDLWTSLVNSSRGVLDIMSARGWDPKNLYLVALAFRHLKVNDWVKGSIELYLRKAVLASHSPIVNIPERIHHRKYKVASIPLDEYTFYANLKKADLVTALLARQEPPPFVLGVLLVRQGNPVILKKGTIEIRGEHEDLEGRFAGYFWDFLQRYDRATEDPYPPLDRDPVLRRCDHRFIFEKPEPLDMLWWVFGWDTKSKTNCLCHNLYSDCCDLEKSEGVYAHRWGYQVCECQKTVIWARGGTYQIIPRHIAITQPTLWVPYIIYTEPWRTQLCSTVPTFDNERSHWVTPFPPGKATMSITAAYGLMCPVSQKLANLDSNGAGVGDFFHVTPYWVSSNHMHCMLHAGPRVVETSIVQLGAKSLIGRANKVSVVQRPSFNVCEFTKSEKGPLLCNHYGKGHHVNNCRVKTIGVGDNTRELRQFARFYYRCGQKECVCTWLGPRNPPDMSDMWLMQFV